METAQLARRLKELREKELRISTQEMADRLGALGVETSNASVSRYESGMRLPPIDYLCGVAMLTGVSLDWLVLDHGPRTRVHEGVDLYRAGMVDLASAVIDALQGKLEENAPPGRRGEDGAIFREAANRLREIGAAEKVRRHEGSGSR